MAESEQGLTVPIRFDFSTADQQFEQREERAKRGLTIPVRTAESGGAAGAVPARGSTLIPAPAGIPVTRSGTPIPTAPAFGAANAVQAEINMAVARGDMSAARHIAAQGAGLGLPVAIPSTPVSGGFPVTRLMPGGFGPFAGQQYGRAVGPGMDPEAALRGAGMRERIDWHAEEFARQGRVREDRGTVLRERAFEHADEFERQDRVRADQIDRQERAAATQARRGQQLASSGFGGGRGWGFAPGMSAMQRLRTVGNTSVLGMGNYMSFMFGGMELAQAAQQQQQAQLEASLAPTDIERMKILGAAASQPSGMFGSMVSQGKNLVASVIGGDSPLKIAETALLETRRRENIDAVRSAQFARQQAYATLGTVGQSDYVSGREQARLVQEKRHRVIDEEYNKIAGQLTSVEPTEQHRYWWGQKYETGGGLSISDEPLRSSMRQRQADLLKEQKFADAERLTTELELTRRLTISTRQQNLATSARNDLFAGNILKGTIATIDAKFDPMRAGGAVAGFEGRAFRDAEGRRLPNIADPDYAKFEAQLYDYQSHVGTAQVVEQRRGQAERQRIEQYRIAHRAAEFSLSYRPLLAQLQTTAGQYAAAQTDIDQRVALGELTPAEGVLAHAANRQQTRDVVTGQLQDRANDRRLIDINLGGREQQISALMNRDPVSAGIAGIVAQTRDEEARLRRGGLFEEADRARRLGGQALELEKRQYLDAFEGVQVSKDFAMAMGMGLMPKSAEDPATVLKNIEGGIKGLQQPGTVAGDDVSGLLREVRNEIKGFADKFLSALQTN